MSKKKEPNRFTVKIKVGLTNSNYLLAEKGKGGFSSSGGGGGTGCELAGNGGLDTEGVLVAVSTGF